MMPAKSRSALRAGAGRAAAITAFATLCLAIGFGAAAAERRDDSYPSVAVSYSDLDMSTQEGVLVLYRRIDAAATTVCGGKPDIRDQLAVVQSRACRRVVMARAVQAVGNPRLAALLATGSTRS